jgi:hypothetical protein
MSDDETKRPRFPHPRDRDPYREAPPRTFTPPSAPVVIAKRADDPPPVDGLTARELDEGGLLSPEKRVGRDASLSETRRAERRLKLLGIVVAVPIAFVGVRIAVEMPTRWLADAVAAIATVAGIVIGRLVAGRIVSR